MEWISVEDRLPLEQDYQSSYHDVMVLVTNGSNVNCGIYAISGNDTLRPWAKFSDYGEIKNYMITHWMPLPEPPKEQIINPIKSCDG